MITITPSEIAHFIPQSQIERQFALLAKDSHQPLMPVSAHDAILLADKRYVDAVLNKHGVIKYLRALVPVSVIHRALNNMHRPTLAASIISIKHQDRGAKRWITRLDRAHSGQIGANRQLFEGAIPFTPLSRLKWLKEFERKAST